MRKAFDSLRHVVFWPVAIIFVVTCIYSLASPESFKSNMFEAKNWVLQHFGWLFSTASLAFFLICVICYISPLGRTRIGGSNAKPLLSKWKWFSITLCTTIAAGILFWGAAEPIAHYHNPPPGLGISGETNTAAVFAQSTMYMHWTLIPYGIYTLAGLMFAYSYYNRKQPFSLGSLVYPLLGKPVGPRVSAVIDIVGLFGLVTGMAAALGAGILMLASGIEHLEGPEKSSLVLGGLALVIVGTFIASAASGLLKGITWLSNWNARIFMALVAFIFFAGPTVYILKNGATGMGDFLGNFFPRSLIGVVSEKQKEWADGWTIFYWAIWLAWTPVTALFLGRIGVGYTFREFIRMNLLFPALFSIVWMSVFGGSALYFNEINDHALHTTMEGSGYGYVVFDVFDQLPITNLIAVVFLIALFLSYVTAADSNTSAMSAISSKGISPLNPEAPMFVKVIWGSLIGLMAWIILTKLKGVDGIQTLSTLGGLPALFLILAVAAGMVRLIAESVRKKYFKKR